MRECAYESGFGFYLLAKVGASRSYALRLGGYALGLLSRFAPESRLRAYPPSRKARKWVREAAGDWNEGREGDRGGEQSNVIERVDQTKDVESSFPQTTRCEQGQARPTQS